MAIDDSDNEELPATMAIDNDGDTQEETEDNTLPATVAMVCNVCLYTDLFGDTEEEQWPWMRRMTVPIWKPL